MTFIISGVMLLILLNRETSSKCWALFFASIYFDGIFLLVYCLAKLRIIFIHVLNDTNMLVHWRTPHTTANIKKNRLQTVERKYIISFKCYSPADFQTHHFHAYFHIFKFTFFICISFIFHLFCINYSVLVFGNAIPLFKEKKKYKNNIIRTAHSQ